MRWLEFFAKYYNIFLPHGNFIGDFFREDADRSERMQLLGIASDSKKRCDNYFIKMIRGE